MGREQDELSKHRHDEQFDRDWPGDPQPKGKYDYQKSDLWKEHQKATKANPALKALAENQNTFTGSGKINQGRSIA